MSLDEKLDFAELEKIFLQHRTNAILDLYVKSPHILCYIKDHKFRIEKSNAAYCTLLFGQHCKYNCDNLYCGYDIDKNIENIHEL